MKRNQPTINSFFPRLEARLDSKKPQERRRLINYENQIYRQFLQEFKQQVQSYFADHFVLYAKLEAILLQSDKEFANIKPLIEFYLKSEVIVGSIDEFEREFYIWIITKLLKIAEDICLPNIAALLKVLVTIGGSSATAERCFSALKHIKNILRNSTGDERLDSLISIYFNSKVSCSEDEVIDEYGKTKPRYNFL